MATEDFASEPIRRDAGLSEVRYRYSPEFVPKMAEIGGALLLATRPHGRVIVIGIHDQRPAIALLHFDDARSTAVQMQRIAVGTRREVWMLHGAPALAPQLQPAGKFDACYLAREARLTGDIHCQTLAFAGDELWLANALFSCLCTLHPDYSFVPRWRPPFVTQLAADDRCHLSGLAVDAGQPRLVSVLAETNTPAGWLAAPITSGALVDVASGVTISRGLTLPHSPRLHANRVWVLNSGLGTLEVVDPATGRRDVAAALPGFARGLAVHEHYAVVGLSRLRPAARSDELPIALHAGPLKCAVAIVDLRSGQTAAFLEFEAGVDEILDIQLLLGVRCPSLIGPNVEQDGAKDIWLVPTPEMAQRAVAAQAPEPTAAELTDEQVTALVRSSLAMQQQGRFAEAVEALQKAVNARPTSAELWNYLGNAWQNLGPQDRALDCYQRATVANPQFAPAHQNLGYLLINMGRLDTGLDHLRQAQQIQPQPLNEVMLATSLPVIYESAAEVAQRRTRLEAETQRLVDKGLLIDVAETIVPTNFFAAYQGYDDCQLQRTISRIYRAPQPVRPGRPAASGRRLRIGFLSSHFCDHTIGCLNIGRVAQLDRQQFEVFVVAIGPHGDSLAQAFKRSADHYLELSGALEAIRRGVVAAQLDLLLFADVGMNTTTYTLAMSRLAGVQCVTWGHPVTTGYASMDYFISSELLETPDADAHYTEQLIRLSNLGTYYYRPVAPPPARTREHFGLDARRTVYLCPQTLFKLHPDFDPLVAEILRRDPQGELVLLEGRHPMWTQLVRERFARTMPDVCQRVRFLPPQPRGDFLQLNALADVSLDTLHFGGGNTSYEALAVGTPVVTLPGPFMRSRIALALYRKLGLLDFVANDPRQYVELAVRLGTDRDYRRRMSEQILEVCPALYEDPSEVRELERFFRWATAQDQGAWSPRG